MSVGWDVKWRGSLRAAAIESVQRNWRGSLRDAYRQLRTDIILTVDLPFLSASERSISLTSLDLLLVAELDLLADLCVRPIPFQLSTANVSPDATVPPS